MEYTTEEISRLFDVDCSLAVEKAVLFYREDKKTKAKKPMARIYYRINESKIKQKDLKLLDTDLDLTVNFRNTVQQLIKILTPSTSSTIIECQAETPLIPNTSKKNPRDASPRDFLGTFHVEKPHSKGGARLSSGRKPKWYASRNNKRLISLRKLKNNRKHKQAKIRRQQKNEMKMAELTSKRQGYIQTLETAISKADFSEVFIGKIYLVSTTQVLKVATQCTALLRYYKSLVEEPLLLKKALYEKVGSSMDVPVSSWTVQNWVIDFEENKGRIRESMQGRWQRRWLLNQEDLKARAIDFLKTAKKDTDVNLKPQLFQHFINNELLVNSTLDIKSVYGIELPISEETARVWMHNLDFHYSATAKDIYYDGHDRPDVVADREQVLERFFHEPDGSNLTPGYLNRTNHYIQLTIDEARKFGFDEQTIEKYLVADTEIVEFHLDDYLFDRDSIELGGNPSIAFKSDENNRPVILVFQDEAIYRAYDSSKKFWHEVRGGGIKKKGEGPGVMVSGFLIEELGFLSLSAEEFEAFKQKQLREGKPEPTFYTTYQGRFYPSLYLFEFGKNRDGYWTGDDMLKHTAEFIDFLEFKLPAYQFVFIFDWSSGHAKYPENAPNVKTMNSTFGGKQPLFRPAQILEDFTYAEDFPANLPRLKTGMFQHMVFQPDDPAPFYKPNAQPQEYVGKAKGLKQVLFERGLYTPNMTLEGDNKNSDDATSMTFVLGNCLDFKLQKSALAEYIESRGHICDYIPKYHPELNPLERCWGMSKRFIRRLCKFQYKDLLVKIHRSLLDGRIQPLSMIRKFFRKSRDYMRAYRSGKKEFADIKLQLKVYKSHRMPPPSECTPLKKYKPHQKKKEMKMFEMFKSLSLENTHQHSEHESSPAVSEYENLALQFSEAMRIVDEDYDSDFPAMEMNSNGYAFVDV